MKVRCMSRLDEQTLRWIDEHFVLTQGHDAQVIIGNPDPDTLADYPHLELLQLESAGYEQYDVEKLNQEKIRLCNASGCFGDMISEYVIGQLIAMYQHFPQYVRQQQRHVWQRAGRVRMISGSTVVIIGMGNLGSSLAYRLHLLGAQVIGVRRQAQITLPGVERMIELKHLSEVLPCADAVILCLPANSGTQAFFTHREFALMKQDAVFVNVGRGSLVNDRDILQALDEGQIGGAILDVTQEEPLPADDPLWDHEQVIITPHAAGTFANDACWKQFGEIVVENLRRFHEGKPLINERRH